jgi:hypothetical protein
MGFKPRISVLERAKTVHAVDRASTVIGLELHYLCINSQTSFRPTVFLLKGRVLEKW